MILFFIIIVFIISNKCDLRYFRFRFYINTYFRPISPESESCLSLGHLGFKAFYVSPKLARRTYSLTVHRTLRGAAIPLHARRSVEDSVPILW